MRSVFSKQDFEIAKIEVEESGETQANRATMNKALEDKSKDDYVEQVAKNIPVEVITLYTGIFGLVQSRMILLTTDAAIASDPVIASAGWIAFVLGIVGTIAYMWWRNRKDKVPNVAIKVGLSLFAFIIWAYTVWWPFANIIPYEPFWGSLLLIVFLFISPLVYEVVVEIEKKYPKLRRSLTNKPNKIAPPAKEQAWFTNEL